MDAKKDYSLKAEQIARFAKALAHPARIQILQFLARQQECYFGDIHEELPIAKATVSQHLRELKDAGLIQGTIEKSRAAAAVATRSRWRKADSLSALYNKVFIRSFTNN